MAVKLLVMVFGIAIFVIAIYIIEHLFEKYECNKYNKELKLRNNDTLLAKYYNEMNNERNDGWTKNHYKVLYKERFNKLNK